MTSTSSMSTVCVMPNRYWTEFITSARTIFSPLVVAVRDKKQEEQVKFHYLVSCPPVTIPLNASSPGLPILVRHRYALRWRVRRVWRSRLDGSERGATDRQCGSAFQ